MQDITQLGLLDENRAPVCQAVVDRVSAVTDTFQRALGSR